MVLVCVAACSSGDDERSSVTTTEPATTAAGTTEPATTERASTAVQTTEPATTEPATTESPTTRPAPGLATLAERTCPPDAPPNARCSTLTVLANHADPGGATIELPVIVLSATGPSPAPDPIVIPAGGPGYPGAEDFGWAGSAWNERRDIVLYDQRGTGGAVPSLECPAVDAAFVDALRVDAPYVQERDAMTVARDACLAELAAAGVDLADYNTESSAADLAALRTALGYDQWNIMGISYGGRLALAAMRSQPEGIRAVILDSVYDVTYGGLADTVEGIEQAFTRFFDGCAVDEACVAKYGDVAATTEQVRQTYNAAPATATADLGAGAGPEGFVITGDDMMAGLFNALYDDALIPLLPGIITGLAAGDTSVLPALIERGVGFATSYADGMAAAVNCADNAGLGSEDADAATFEEPGRLGLVVAQNGPCGEDVVATPGAFNEPVTSDIPALVLAGSYDPITPPAGTRAVADRLGARFFLVEPGGHGVNSFDDCLIAIGTAFLDDPTAGPGGESCVAATAPVTFG